MTEQPPAAGDGGTPGPDPVPPAGEPTAPGWSPHQPPPWQAPGGYAGTGWGQPPGPVPGTPPWPGAGAPYAPPPGAAGPPPPPGYPPPGYPPPGYPPPGYPPPGAWRPPPTAPKPGVVPLRPLGLGELLDGAVTYIRRNPRATLGLATVLSLASAVVQFFVLLAALQSVSGAAGSTAGSDLEDLTADALLGTSLASNAATLVSLAVSVVVQIIATGVFTVIIGGAVLGVPMTAGEAWRRARPFLWRLLGLTVLSTLAVAGILVVGLLLAVLVGVALAPWGLLLAVPLGLAAIAASVWLYVELLLAPVALVLERAPVLTAWRRSFALTARSWWRIFGIFLLTQIIASLVSSVLVVPLTVLGTIGSVAVGAADTVPWPLLLTAALGQLVGGIVTLPFVSGVTALLYVDRRMRREALDLRLATVTAAGPGAVVPMTAGFPPADPLLVYVDVPATPPIRPATPPPPAWPPPPTGPPVV